MKRRRNIKSCCHLEENDLKIDDFGVEMWLNEHETHCRYNLSETCALPLTLGELADMTCGRGALADDIMKIKLDYGDITGSERLRELIAGLYGSVSADRVTIAHGAIGANALVLMSLISAGDKVVCVVPAYQQHYSLPSSIGADISFVYLKEENGWQVDLDELAEAVGTDTRAVCINNPDNPTGSVMDEKILKAIADICARSGAWLLCDEAYRGLNYYGEPFGVSAVDLYEKAVVTGSMSKTFSLAGVRLGWIAGPREVIDDINRYRDYHIISVGKIDDLISCLALENRDMLSRRNADICRENEQTVSDWVDSERGFSYVRPHAGTTAFIRFDLDMGSEELCERAQNEAGVMFVLGSAFGYDDHFRLGFGRENEMIRSGLQAFSEWLVRIRQQYK